MIHDNLKESILLVVRELCGIREQIEQHNKNYSILKRMEEMEKSIMSAISEFAAKQNAFNKRQSDATDALTVSVSDLSGDIQTLNDKITELQNNPGPITPEDQALLDSLTTQGESMAKKVEALSTALSALAALTPPKAPNT